MNTWTPNDDLQLGLAWILARTGNPRTTSQFFQDFSDHVADRVVNHPNLHIDDIMERWKSVRKRTARFYRCYLHVTANSPDNATQQQLTEDALNLYSFILRKEFDLLSFWNNIKQHTELIDEL